MDHNIGMYGRMRRRYLQEYRPDIWAEYVRAGELSRHLVELDTACYEQMAYLISEMAKREGVTEALKAADPMTWVGWMNSIRNRAEEIILHNLVYVC